MKKIKALALFSGGLDSLLSMKLLIDQGIEVTALHFNIGFGGNKDKREYFENATAQIGAKLLVCDIREQFFNDVLFKPKYGYGKYFNPCIDCHANMFRNAFYKMLELDADFVLSGEVLGQRPKSQRKEALNQVRKLVREVGEEARFDPILDRTQAGGEKPQFLDELLLRPMSAKLLEPTFMEKKGFVDREKLLDVSGRGRSRQLQMIKDYGLKYYEKPGGGCLLTDIQVSNKIKNLKEYREMVFEDGVIVKNGRYFVLPHNARLVVARNEEENHKLDIQHPLMDKIELLSCKGPLSLVDKNASKEDKELAGRIALGYAKTLKNQAYLIQIGNEKRELYPLDKESAREYLFA
ncbi:MnmA/TRMU family protein [Helicobacter pylori]|uniref:MnmA/TRMU family protein n=1 Tax=Helicobacter pylori TaxID=210 RepID=UPI000C2FFA48|nr:MnmA/TRMU family protein [Helicobacter pylori]MCQ2744806.1 7-cyano-7-deazaguanine synthase [Helicobacter pylori]